MTPSTVTTDIGTITMRPDGILHVVFDFEGEITQEIAAAYLDVRNAMVGTASPPVLIQIKRFPYVERSIRSFFLSGLAHPPCRAVVSVDQTFITLWRTFDLVSPVEVPSKVFPNLDNAVQWIHEQVDQT